MTRLDYVSAIWNLNGDYWDELLMSLPGYRMSDTEFYDWIYAQLGI